jgi:DNA-binding transcriptional regulator PaaX
MMAKQVGETQQKILLLLMGGVALGLAGNPRRYFRIAKEIGKEWQKIERRQLQRSIKLLYESQLVEIREHKGNITELVLSKEGKLVALRYDLDKLTIEEPKRWDNKWRIVMFDIPEEKKKLRDTIRYHLKKLRFFEYQKSVFVHPYSCADEIEYVIEFYGIRQYVRFIEAIRLDNELHLKSHFNIP